MLSLLLRMEEVATGHRGEREREPEERPNRCGGCRTCTADMCLPQTLGIACALVPRPARVTPGLFPAKCSLTLNCTGHPHSWQAGQLDRTHVFFGTWSGNISGNCPKFHAFRLPLFKRKSRPGFLRSARGTPVFTGAAILLGAHRAGVRVVLASTNPRTRTRASLDPRAPNLGRRIP